MRIIQHESGVSSPSLGLLCCCVLAVSMILPSAITTTSTRSASFLLSGANAFTIAGPVVGSSRSSNSHRRASSLLALGNDGDDDDDSAIRSSSSSNTAMSETSYLSHVHLKVPSVAKSVEYWTCDEKGGTVKRSRSNGMANGEEELLSAFVEMGYTSSSSSSSSSSSNDSDANDDNKDRGGPFALELIKTTKKNYSVGNTISYVGLSMLLQFQNQKNNKKNPLLEMMIKGEKEQPTSDDVKDDDNAKEVEEEPNGIPVKYVASAPGDYFAQFALRSKDLSKTCDFYTTVLGMNQKAQDQHLLCLRYDNSNNNNNNGVATTLVFENADDDCVLEKGDCFDHLVITTTSSVKTLYEEILQENDSSSKKKNNDTKVIVFMKPTPMFGTTVLGLIDPNGYKVVVAGKQ